MKPLSEKRVSTRHSVQKNALILCPECSGEIIDISEHGIAFTHITGNKWPTDQFKIDLLLDNSSTIIIDIPCLLAYPQNDKNSSSNLRHAISFGELSFSQSQQIKEYISNSTGPSITFPVFTD